MAGASSDVGGHVGGGCALCSCLQEALLCMWQEQCQHLGKLGEADLRQWGDWVAWQAVRKLQEMAQSSLQLRRNSPFSVSEIQNCRSLALASGAGLVSDPHLHIGLMWDHKSNPAPAPLWPGDFGQAAKLIPESLLWGCLSWLALTSASLPTADCLAPLQPRWTVWLLDGGLRLVPH